MTQTPTDPTPDEPRVTATQIAELAGVGASAVSNWRKRFPDFPRPVGAAPGGGDLFLLPEVEEWLRGRDKPIHHKHGTIDQLWLVYGRLRGRPLPSEPGVVLACAAALFRLARVLDLPLETEAGESQIRVDERVRDAIAAVSKARPDIGPAFDLVAHLNADDVRLVVDALADFPTREELASAIDAMLSRASRYGEFRTNPSFAQLLATLAAPADQVFDPAAGSGELLLAAAAHAKRRKIRLYGQELSPDGWRLAIARSVLHDVSIDIRLGDSFLEDAFPQLRADVIVCEPPFGGRTAPVQGLPGDPRWQLLGLFESPAARGDEFAWLAHVIHHLAPEGRGYVLLPAGNLFRGGVEARLRAELLRRGCIEAIISLSKSPSDKSSIARAIWIVRKPTPDPLDVLLVAGEFAAAPEALTVVISAVNAWREGQSIVDRNIARSVPILELLAGDAPLLPSRWVGEPAAVEPTTLARAAENASRELLEVQRAPHPAIPDFTIASLDEPRPRVRVGELIETGRAKLVKANRAKSEDYRSDSGMPVWLPADVRPTWEREEVQRYLHPDQVDPRSITEPGDIVLTTIGGIRTRVDHEGGHVLGTSLQALRLISGALDPRAVAALLPSEANQRLQTGTTIPRVNIRELEIPVLDPHESEMLIALMAALDQEQQIAEDLVRRAAAVRSSVIAALSTGVAELRESDGSQR